MGYRSEVVALFYTHEQSYGSFKLFFDENFPMEAFKDFGWGGIQEFGRGYEPTKGFKIQFNDVKWYSGTPFVDEFYNFLSKFKELAFGVPMPWHYEFIRIGEDRDDIEQHRTEDGEHLLSFNVSIYSEV